MYNLSIMLFGGCAQVQVSAIELQNKKARINPCSFWWCGLRFANGANAPACDCSQHFVLRLLAMSTALDFRKYYALASLFACGHKSLGDLCTKK